MPATNPVGHKFSELSSSHVALVTMGDNSWLSRSRVSSDIHTRLFDYATCIQWPCQLQG